jgi:hypothetical protein
MKKPRDVCLRLLFFTIGQAGFAPMEQMIPPPEQSFAHSEQTILPSEQNFAVSEQTIPPMEQNFALC